MELIPFKIHEDVEKILNFHKLKTLNMDKYVFDDSHENQYYLNNLDPKKWKDQDHYSVLRIKKVRFNASQELIKKAYRKQLLDHHPDKGRKRVKKCEDENSDYFVCITNAYDLLRNPITRRTYDSIDPEFDNRVPSLKDAKSNFLKSFSTVFELNSRWSKIQPVPSLGDETTPYEDVIKFYNFWNNFSSWREFTYLDAESSSNNDNRDERRYNEKQNRSERKRLTAEENRRINNLVDLAQSNDPRIKKYNDDRKAEKEADKKAKEDKKLQLRLEAERIFKEEKERNEKIEAEKNLKIKEETNSLKKQKEAIKSRQKNEKRRFRKNVENKDFFVDVLTLLEPSKKSQEMRKAEMMNLVEIICQKSSLEDLVDLNNELETCNEKDMVSVIRRKESELTNKNGFSTITEINGNTEVQNGNCNRIDMCGDREWNFELTQLLIKAINHFVAGTKDRWLCISDYMNSHVVSLVVNEKQIIYKSKSIKKDDTNLKKEAAIHNFTSKTNQNITESLKNVHITDRADVLDISKVWLPDEQKRLEAALKTIPASDGARWDKISEHVATRTKKECILRFKELAEKLKAKKLTK